MTPRTDFAVTNYLGVTIRTFNNLPDAIKWTEIHKDEHAGLEIQRVTYSIRRTSVYRPNPLSEQQVAA